MNIFKILIPKEKAQEVAELESWTVKWEVKRGWSNDTYVYHKSFINERDAKEFSKQLKESAKFIKCWIDVEMSKN